MLEFFHFRNRSVPRTTIFRQSGERKKIVVSVDRSFQPGHLSLVIS